MKARDAILTVLDFESTGAVSGHADEPWQVGMVEMQGGRVTGRHYESFLRVAASRQVAVGGGTWVEAPVEAATIQKLEDIILTKARELRRSAIAG